MWNMKECNQRWPWATSLLLTSSLFSFLVSCPFFSSLYPGCCRYERQPACWARSAPLVDAYLRLRRLNVASFAHLVTTGMILNPQHVSLTCLPPRKHLSWQGSRLERGSYYIEFCVLDQICLSRSFRKILNPQGLTGLVRWVMDTALTQELQLCLCNSEVLVSPLTYFCKAKTMTERSWREFSLHPWTHALPSLWVCPVGYHTHLWVKRMWVGFKRVLSCMFLRVQMYFCFHAIFSRPERMSIDLTDLLRFLFVTVREVKLNTFQSMQVQFY